MTEYDKFGNQQIFEIDDVESQSEGNWQVRGVVYDTICHNDTLYLYEEISSQNIKTYSFTVGKITVYGHILDEVGRGLSAILLLKGENGDKLKQSNHLCK